MAGIAIFNGNGAKDVDPCKVIRALSFTGEETQTTHKGERFFATSVQVDRETSLAVTQNTLVLLDGEVFEVEGIETATGPGESVPVAVILELLEKKHLDLIHRLNGSFILVAYFPGRDKLLIANDRFGSRPLFFSERGREAGFSSRIEGLAAMGFHPFSKVRLDGFCELLTMSRVLFGKTLWEGVHSLPAGSILSVERGQLRVECYYHKVFHYPEVTEFDENEAASGLAQALEHSGRLRIPRTGSGIMLSGGLDSRVVLACSSGEMTSFTLCNGQNFETRVAGKAAFMRGSEQVLVPLDPYHYLNIIGSAARTCEGSFNYEHSPFEGMAGVFKEHSVEIVFHGFFLDALFQLAHTPVREISLGPLRRPVEIMKDMTWDSVATYLAEHFSISVDPLRPLSDEVKARCAGHVSHSIAEFVESNRRACPSPYDIIQLFQIQDMGRWTTFPMILGLRAGIKERTLAADNRLLEYCLSTPPDSRFASRLYKRALRELDPAMAHLPNANEYLPADLEINP